MSRRARAVAVLAVSAFAVVGPYAATASASPDAPAGGQPTPIEVAPNAAAGSICLLGGLICLF